MTKQPLKFTTVFGIAMIAIGLILEIGALFYHIGSRDSAEAVFTGAIALSVGNAFMISHSLKLSLTLSVLGSLGVGYFVFVSTHFNWLWFIVAVIAFVAFMISLLKLRETVRINHNTWQD
ncbi:hypothetical protein GPK34_08275 [Secundilactobacillus kimchicus]|uniref:Integral membrane protein n=1 Tax=Secundilactobacillus kimchicus JCM 15530 TaxID=1302272 RepID=A0A0R1HQ56_9LACO|nr:hypothetical protein [Secundilactobacillus kimchicus]KRK48768.1 hypothetical protein FC96_GL001087 [Secundilactobacillus kimchicus JCM 15530]MBT9672023.1 hypothetical protein [Secundilactobacillus kimchicus]